MRLRKACIAAVLAAAATGCSVDQVGLEYPPGMTEMLHLSALTGEEDRMDTRRGEPGDTAAGLPPLCSVSRNEREDTVATDVVYPLFSYRRRKDVRETAFRPLFYVKQDPVENRTDAWFIYPLGRYRRVGKNRYFSFWPFYWNKQYHAGRHVNHKPEPSTGSLEEFAERKTLPGETMDLDWALYPILFGGADQEHGKYFAFFPVGGMIKGMLGKEWMRFVLFPLYLESYDKRYHSWNVIWPVFGYWRGPDQRGWRFWPICGSNVREGKFSRKFFLWPLGVWWRVGLDLDNSTTVFTLLPFYGQMDNKHLHIKTVMWPFFSRKYDDRRGLVEWHCPWPIYSCTRGHGLEGVKVWPFFGYRASNSQRNLTVMWPLYTRTLKREEARTTLTRSSCLVFYQWTEKWREYDLGDKTVVAAPPRNDTGTIFGERWVPDPRFEEPATDPRLIGAPYEEYERTFWKVWPICHYRKGADGSRAFQMLSPLPWRGSPGSANTYAPFWTLYRWQQDGEGQIREYALFGLYHNIRDDHMRDVNVLGLVQYRREGWYYKKFFVLGGLVGYERVGYDKGMRFLWIPVNRIGRDEWDRYRSGGFMEEEQ
ncbi:MAG: hypothetical protein JW909_03770 [Planctomycetes bacterium]|nr:hypothetical protein [Planctomycetota bacterium]